MSETTLLNLPFIAAGQAQKHVTHNEALRILDALTQLAVNAVSDSPPLTPEDGERHIVGASPAGAFTDRANAVAAFQDGGWVFFAPRAGWRAWNAGTAALLVWSGTAWEALSPGGGGGGFDPDAVDYLFINGADPAEPSVKLAVRANDVLLHALEVADSGTGDMRLQLSREGGGDTASVFFADSFSGRAEFGLIESGAFRLKVSGDGASWLESLVVDPVSGAVRLPQNDVANIVVLADQAAYDALDPPDAGTLYLVPEEE